ncbi:MAG: N-acetylmuramoyl-L-alanine amidase [Gammaproteobacteria bacterium]
MMICFVFLQWMVAYDAVATARVEGMRVWASSDRTRFVLDMSQKPSYKVFPLSDPHRVVLDLSDVRWDTKAKTDLKNSIIYNIRMGRRERDVLRLVLDVHEPATISHFMLPPNQQYPYRLVLDLQHARMTSAQPKPPKAKPVSPPPRTPSLRELVVVVDPGHGGEDPGAVGPKGTKEKNVVLKIARALYDQLNREVGIRAVLTRDGDYFVGLRDRRQLARDRYQADLFVSIHADAWTRPSARGASVFVVSRKGASSTLAQFLADTANRSDRIGGVELNDNNKILKTVLADLALEGNLEHSFRVGDAVLSSLGDVAHLHKHGIEQAGFMVLKSLDVPSILVETGFISNPGDERKLRSSAYQRKLAMALSSGIVNYFRQYPPPETLFAAWYGDRLIEHRIAAGETLSDIAQRYGVTLRSIQELNSIHSDFIEVRQILRVPNS